MSMLGLPFSLARRRPLRGVVMEWDFLGQWVCIFGSTETVQLTINNPAPSTRIPDRDKKNDLLEVKQLAQDHKTSHWQHWDANPGLSPKPTYLATGPFSPNLGYCMSSSGCLQEEPVFMIPPDVLGNSRDAGWMFSTRGQDSPESVGYEISLRGLSDSSLTLVSSTHPFRSDQEVAIKPGQTVPVLLSVVIHQAVTEHLFSEDPSVWTKAWNAVSSVLVWSLIVVSSLVYYTQEPKSLSLHPCINFLF